VWRTALDDLVSYIASRRVSHNFLFRESMPDFYMGKYPVTNEQFEQFVTESGYKAEAERRGNHVFIRSNRDSIPVD
jgi:formylglycine-generating enzyme required for sulfatase activity